MITLTAEQAQQIKEALKYARNVCVGSNWSTDDTDEALSTLRAARAQEQIDESWCIDPRPVNGLLSAEQAEQEPVAWMNEINGFICKEKTRSYHVPLYAAPVRTKDLTDDEIEKITGHRKVGGNWPVAVLVGLSLVALDREKNK